MSGRPPTVDVLLPAFNAAATVASALDSMTGQTVRDLRVIVVDDGSTDDTARIVAARAAADPRIVVITTPNRGIVDALNTALAASTAAFVARHDADDIAYPDRLERQLAYLRAHPDVIAVSSNADHIDAVGRRTGKMTGFTLEVEGDPYYVPSVEPYLLHPFLLARRQPLVDAGGYRHSFHTEDTDLYWRLAGHGRLANMPDALGEYRLHAGSVSSRSILNGRIAATMSQRAAVSERRRREGEPDLPFDKAMLDRLQTAVDLQPIVAIAAEGMSRDERDWLEIATAAKLLDQSAYRPYRLTASDRRTIRGWLATHYDAVDRYNRRQLVFRSLLAPSVLRLRLFERLSMLPPRIVPAALFDAVAQRARRLFARERGGAARRATAAADRGGHDA